MPFLAESESGDGLKISHTCQDWLVAGISNLLPAYLPPFEHRGAFSPLAILEPPPARKVSQGWRELIKNLYEVDPLICPGCGTEMKVIAFITNHEVIDKVIRHLRLIFKTTRPPPHQQEELY